MRDEKISSIKSERFSDLLSGSSKAKGLSLTPLPLLAIPLKHQYEPITPAERAFTGNTQMFGSRARLACRSTATGLP